MIIYQPFIVLLCELPAQVPCPFVKTGLSVFLFLFQDLSMF